MKYYKPSHPIDKTIHDPLFAGVVELDGELVAVHGYDVAVAEFQVKHALAAKSLSRFGFHAEGHGGNDGVGSIGLKVFFGA